MIIVVYIQKKTCPYRTNKVYFKGMVNKIIKSFVASCMVFVGWFILLLMGIVFRTAGESVGLSGNESVGCLFLLVFVLSYVSIRGLEK